MRLLFSSATVENQCRSIKAAGKLFGGDSVMARSLHARINALEQASTIHDIIMQPQFRFHKLEKRGRKDLEGLFSIDVKTRRDAWRIILQPLDENEMPYVPCHIDEVSTKVRIVAIREVSNHYA